MPMDGNRDARADHRPDGAAREAAAGAGEAESLLSKEERIRKYGEVFTPEWVVKKMCDVLEAENPGAFAPEKTYLEPACGDGAFVEEILRRKFGHCRSREDFRTALKSVWAFEIQEQNVTAAIARITRMCREHFPLGIEERQIIGAHIILCDALKVMKLLDEWRRSDG